MKSLFSSILILTLGTSLAQNTFTQEDRERLIRLEVKLEEMQKQMDARFEAVDKRFELIDKRFDDVNSRLDQQFNLILGVLAAFVAMFMGLLGFAIWDRKQAVKPVQEETTRLAKDVSRLNQLLEAMRELSKKDERVMKILKQFNLL